MPPHVQKHVPLFFCPCNIAKYDRTRSRRKPAHYSHPDSAFLRIMTAGIRELREKRYNRARNGAGYARIPPGLPKG